MFTCCWRLAERSRTWPGTGSTVLLFAGWSRCPPAACAGPRPWWPRSGRPSASPSGWWSAPDTRTATRRPGSRAYTGHDWCRRSAASCRSRWGSWSLCDPHRNKTAVFITFTESWSTWKYIRLQQCMLTLNFNVRNCEWNWRGMQTIINDYITTIMGDKTKLFKRHRFILPLNCINYIRHLNIIMYSKYVVLYIQIYLKSLNNKYKIIFSLLA